MQSAAHSPPAKATQKRGAASEPHSRRHPHANRTRSSSSSSSSPRHHRRRRHRCEVRGTPRRTSRLWPIFDVEHFYPIETFQFQRWFLTPYLDDSQTTLRLQCSVEWNLQKFLNKSFKTAKTQFWDILSNFCSILFVAMAKRTTLSIELPSSLDFQASNSSLVSNWHLSNRNFVLSWSSDWRFTNLQPLKTEEKMLMELKGRFLDNSLFVWQKMPHFWWHSNLGENFLAAC